MDEIHGQDLDMCSAESKDYLSESDVEIGTGTDTDEDPSDLANVWDYLADTQPPPTKEHRLQSDHGVIKYRPSGHADQTSQLFEYTRLEHQHDIRLLRLLPDVFGQPIRGELFHTRLPQCICVFEHMKGQDCPECREYHAPDYEAISYTWGDMTATDFIQVNGRLLPVTSNCALTLIRLRYTNKPRLIWIDAICIDQKFLQERNHQLHIMNRIYGSASKVLIFLGDGDSSTDLAMKIVHTIGLSESGKDLFSDVLHFDSASAILGIVQRPWFNRIWVLQEVAWSWSATVICGGTELPWDSFRKGLLRLVGKLSFEPPSVLSFKRDNLHNYFDMTPQVMFSELSRTRHCKATDPLDKIYALYPLASPFNDQLSLPPVDYNQSPLELNASIATTLRKHWT
jgi:Heterokaryon incompatibility protein (HET)